MIGVDFPVCVVVIVRVGEQGNIVVACGKRNAASVDGDRVAGDRYGSAEERRSRGSLRAVASVKDTRPDIDLRSCIGGSGTVEVEGEAGEISAGCDEGFAVGVCKICTPSTNFAVLIADGALCGCVNQGSRCESQAKAKEKLSTVHKTYLSSSGTKGDTGTVQKNRGKIPTTVPMLTERGELRSPFLWDAQADLTK